MRDSGRGVDGELRRAANAEPDPSLASSPLSAGHGKTRFAAGRRELEASTGLSFSAP